MAVSAKNFRFISPGIRIEEIDRSQIPADEPAIGACVIGGGVLVCQCWLVGCRSCCCWERLAPGTRLLYSYIDTHAYTRLLTA